jgi:hypothetical protein
MIHAESVKAWEAETEYFRSIIASKDVEIARLRGVLERALYIIDNNPNALVCEVAIEIRKALAKEGK